MIEHATSRVAAMHCLAISARALRLSQRDHDFPSSCLLGKRCFAVRINPTGKDGWKDAWNASGGSHHQARGKIHLSSSSVTSAIAGRTPC